MNPPYYYNVSDKVQSARGGCNADKDGLLSAAVNKITNIL